MGMLRFEFHSDGIGRYSFELHVHRLSGYFSCVLIILHTMWVEKKKELLLMTEINIVKCKT